MVTIVKPRRLFNSGRRKRYRKNPKKRMTLLQKLHFGSKAQRASAAKSLKGNRGRRRKQSNRSRLKRNVSSIITVWPKGNTTRKRRRVGNRSKKIVIVNKGGKMARTRRRKRTNRSYRRRRNYSRRRRNVNYVRRVKRGQYRRRQNPGMTRTSKLRRLWHRHFRRRRNPGMLSGTMGRIAGVVGGIAVTKLLYGFVPSTFTSGVLSYLSIGVIAFAQGKLVGKVSKNSGLGEDFLVGGFAYLVAKMLNDFFPTVGSYTGISGMGLIGGSSFYLPQVNQPGSMGAFQVPAAVSMALPAPVATPSQSLGRIRRSGRLM